MFKSSLKYRLFELIHVSRYQSDEIKIEQLHLSIRFKQQFIVQNLDACNEIINLHVVRKFKNLKLFREICIE